MKNETYTIKLSGETMKLIRKANTLWEELKHYKGDGIREPKILDEQPKTFELIGRYIAAGFIDLPF